MGLERIQVSWAKGVAAGAKPHLALSSDSLSERRTPDGHNPDGRKLGHMPNRSEPTPRTDATDARDFYALKPLAIFAVFT